MNGRLDSDIVVKLIVILYELKENWKVSNMKLVTDWWTKKLMLWKNERKITSLVLCGSSRWILVTIRLELINSVNSESYQIENNYFWLMKYSLLIYTQCWWKFLNSRVHIRIWMGYFFKLIVLTLQRAYWSGWLLTFL